MQKRSAGLSMVNILMSLALVLRPSAGLAAAAVLLAVLCPATEARAASAERVLHSFNCADGNEPIASLIFDSAGNLYGTTLHGGAYGWGSVFELTPTARGKWIEKVLHSFNVNVGDGVYPFSSLTLDSAGNLYGTAYSSEGPGYGAVFELSRTVDAQGEISWSESILHRFNGTDGDHPATRLIFDASGNLYGTTSFGGAYDSGIVFELKAAAHGVWTETVLHTFNAGLGLGPYEPDGDLVFDSVGNLYGTTLEGGPGGGSGGTVFELKHNASGKWKVKTLHSFIDNGRDGYSPLAGLLFDTRGGLYGTTGLGGAYNYGTVFKLVHNANGTWTEKILHSFNNNGIDGAYKVSGLIRDAAGNLYDTTDQGGDPQTGCFGNGCGTVFKLKPGAKGSWNETILHSFRDNGRDGTIPDASLILDQAGNLYGTTSGGGTDNCGTVFEVTP